MPDECHERRFAGLTAALSQWVARQAEAEGQLKGERCPGEEVCSKAGPIANYPHDPIETVCGGCSKRDTKPGNVPRDLAHWLGVALELDVLKEAGAVFTYPDGLTPWEWAALRALQSGRLDARQREQIRAAREAERQATMQRLAGMVGAR